MPQDFPRRRFQCHEIPFRVAGEHQTSGRGQNAGPRRRRVSPFPLQRASQRIERTERTPEWRRIVVWEICASVIRVTFFELLRRGTEDVALLAGRDVEQLGLWVIGGR